MTFNPRTGDVSLENGETLQLPRTLFTLATLLCARPGTTVTRADLATALGYRAESYKRAADSAVCRLRRRLPGRIEAVNGYGYRWTPAA
ncbi:MAG: winged helix-turn-helix domain-containing protein [Terriglobales bacterium]